MTGVIQAATMSCSRTRLILWAKVGMRGVYWGDSRREGFVLRVELALRHLRSLLWVALMSWVVAVVVASYCRNRTIISNWDRVLRRLRAKAESWMDRWIWTKLEVEFQWPRLNRIMSEGSYRRTREDLITSWLSLRELFSWDNRTGCKKRARRLIWSIMSIARLNIWIRALSMVHMTRIALPWRVDS